MGQTSGTGAGAGGGTAQPQSQALQVSGTPFVAAGGNAASGAANSQTPPTPGASNLPNQQVAPLTAQQQEAMGSVSQQSPLAQDFLNLAEGQQANTLGGANAQAADQQQLSAIGGANAQSANAEQLATINGAGLSQNNPYLAAYFNSAAQPLTQQFEQATAPNILANAASTGTVGSAGANQAMGNAQTALSEGLGNLASGLYEPAYAQGVQNQQNAAQNAQGQAASAAQNAQGQAASAAQSAPSLASGQYIPASQLSASGQIGQNQAQNVLSAQYQNLLSQANYPMQELGQLGTALGTASGGGGVSQSISQLLGGAGGGK